MKTRQKVEQILKDYPATRDSDRELRKQYGRTFYGLTEEQVKVFDLFQTDFETIRRNRQKIQEEGLYPANKEVKQFRDDRQDEVKDEMGYLTKNNVQGVIEEKQVSNKYQSKLFEVGRVWN
ncbi:MAG: hypothetical protein Q8910_12495 [Bacteroidota bacterium]|nr:hypothetical protein [Bacteroidota bacterium]